MYKYNNGNYEVVIFSNGTKIRSTYHSEFIADSPESIDLKITNCCDLNCNFCHEESHISGSHGNIMNKLNLFKGLNNGTEIAIGGGNPLSHPDLIDFISELNKLKLICNITVNAFHLLNEKYLELLNYLISNNLVYGVGVSYSEDMISVSTLNHLVSRIEKKDNIVIHVIAGLVDIDNIVNLLRMWKKVLILGYKKYGRGKVIVDGNKIQLKFNQLNNYLESLFLYGIVSFDNLAIKQLNLKDRLSAKMYNKYYMGDDGKFTMYVDIVKGQFASSSISNKINMSDYTIKECFNKLSDY